MALLTFAAVTGLPQSWVETSPLSQADVLARSTACCDAGALGTDLKYIVWPPETAPTKHFHPCCDLPLMRPLVRRGISHAGDASLARFTAMLRRRQPVRIAVLGSSVASVPLAGANAKVDEVAQAWGEVRARSPPGRGWALMFSEWLDALWPSSDGRPHTVFALGRGGCGADGWADCMHTHIPQGTELYILEMGLVLSGDDHSALDDPSTDGAKAAQVAGAALEKILRHLLSLPHRQPPIVREGRRRMGSIWVRPG